MYRGSKADEDILDGHELSNVDLVNARLEVALRRLKRLVPYPSCWLIPMAIVVLNHHRDTEMLVQALTRSTSKL